MLRVCGWLFSSDVYEDADRVFTNTARTMRRTK
jgi:hypothetical protein